jgi:hypothetical protein
MSVDMRHALRHVECLANPSAMQGARWGSVDMRHALRHVECLANPSAMQGARWGSVDMRYALRHVECLANPSELRLEGVPDGQGAKWVVEHCACRVQWNNKAPF